MATSAQSTVSEFVTPFEENTEKQVTFLSNPTQRRQDHQEPAGWRKSRYPNY
jgi:hypothetical protein